MNKRTLTDEAMSLNNLTKVNYYDRLKMLAVSIFEWEGLEEIGCDSRFLEIVLFEEGKAVFVEDPDVGYLVTRVAPNGKLNVYNLPTEIEAVATGYHKKYDMDEVVYIMNNDLQMPTSGTIELFSKKLYELDRTIDINIRAQKTPVLIIGNERQRLTLQNLYMQYDGNMPFIFGEKDINVQDMVKSISTKAEYIANELCDTKHDIWNECLTFLGIDNANTDKRERLITDEVKSNNELVSFYLNCFYKTRKKACDEINHKFFDDEPIVKLRVNKNIAELLDRNLINVDMKEGEEDE